MPNIPPMVSHMSQAQVLGFPAGLSKGLTWSANTPGTNLSTATISVPGVTATSVISAAVQSGVFADTTNAWLVDAVPDAGTITFGVYTQPTTPASFVIAWAVAQF